MRQNRFHVSVHNQHFLFVRNVVYSIEHENHIKKGEKQNESYFNYNPGSAGAGYLRPAERGAVISL